MTNGTTPQAPSAPQASQSGQAPQAAEPKKGKGLKIFLGILGGCVVILIILGVVGYFMVKRAAKKAGEEWGKALNELEQVNTLSLNEFGNISFNWEEVNTANE